MDSTSYLFTYNTPMVSQKPKWTFHLSKASASLTLPMSLSTLHYTFHDHWKPYSFLILDLKGVVPLNIPRCSYLISFFAFTWTDPYNYQVQQLGLSFPQDSDTAPPFLARQSLRYWSVSPFPRLLATVYGWPPACYSMWLVSCLLQYMDSLLLCSPSLSDSQYYLAHHFPQLLGFQSSTLLSSSHLSWNFSHSNP